MTLAVLLKAGADVDAIDDGRESALHLACVGGHVHVVETLIEYGATMDILDAHGRSPAHVAVASGYVSILDFFLAHTGGG